MFGANIVRVFMLSRVYEKYFDRFCQNIFSEREVCPGLRKSLI
jgi:hypothetical protein